MDLAEILFIAFGLAMDASAVSLVAAAFGFVSESRSIFRLAFHFGLFQALMPVLGWLLGIRFSAYFSTYDHWIAFGLLLFVGGRMMLSGLQPETDSFSKDPSRGFTLILLSIATSIDAFAIGLTLAMLDVMIWYPVVIIGFVTALFSVISIKIGNKLGILRGKRMEILGGIILIGMGVRILLSHSH